VISPQLEMRDINPVHWKRLMELMLPPPGGDPQPGSSGGALSLLARASAPERRSTTALSPAMPAIVLHRAGAPVRVLRLGGGALSPDGLAAPVSQEGLRAFRRRHDLPFAAAVDIDLLPQLWADAQAAVRHEDDYAVQLLAMVKAFRDALGRGVLVDPRLFGKVPLPSPRVLQATFNRVLPDGRSFVLYITNGGGLHASLIAVKRHGDLTLVTTHDAIADSVRFGSIRSDARAVLRAVTERFAPPHIGVFLPLSVWHETVAGDRSAIARAMAGRRALLDPAPAWVLALVGVGVVAEGTTRVGRLAGQLLTGKLGLGGRRAQKLAQTLSNPLDALGLDPWELLRWGRDWSRRIKLDRSGLHRPTR